MDTSNVKNNLVKNQHFIPQFYLKNFSNKENLIQILNLAERRIENPKGKRGVGCEYFFYARKTGVPDFLSQEIERWLEYIENFVAIRLPEIIKNIKEYRHIKEDERYVLSILMSLLWLRSPGMRSQLQKMDEDFGNKLKLRGIENDNLHEQDNVDHLKFMIETIGLGGKEGFTNMFFNMDWKAYIIQNDKCFITTSSPVIERFLPPKIFMGNNFLQRKKYFALTPKILLHLTYPQSNKKFKRKVVYINDDIRMFNMIIVGGSVGYAYSQRIEELESLLESSKNGGRLEDEYYNKYEKPWDEHRVKNKS